MRRHPKAIAATAFATLLTLILGVSLATAADAPSIDPLAHTSGVTQKAATLHTEVNPNGDETSYRFEWGADTSYGNIVPIPDKAIGDGIEPVEVSAAIVGLSPGTSYHYRLVASNSLSAVEGPDHEFRTWPVPEEVKPGQYPGQGFLPDNRAWEMVSPPNKSGGEVTLGLGSLRGSATGGSILFDSNVAFSDAKGTGAVGVVTYQAERGPLGWTVHSLMPKQAGTLGAVFAGAAFMWVSPDQTSAILTANDPPLALGAPEGVPNLYLIDPHGGAARLITENQSGSSIEATDPFYRPAFADISADHDEILFESKLALTADGIDGVWQLYEWDEGVVRTVGVLPDTDCPTPPCIATAGSSAGPGGSGEFTLDAESSMSEDGARVYFTAPPSEDGHLYLRVREENKTIPVAESESANPDPTPRPSRFWGASSNGERALFTTGEQLVDDDQNPPASETINGASSDLYRYEHGPNPKLEDNLTLISADHDPSDGLQAGVIGVLGSSLDQSYIYFAASGRLTAGQDPATEPAPAIYLWHNGTQKYVGPIFGGLPDGYNWIQEAARRSSRVTPDGRVLVFTSTVPQPGGYDNNSHGEVYRYDVAVDAAQCLSCNPSGAPAVSNSGLAVPDVTAATAEYRTRLSQALSSDGGRVFFSTSDALVSGDSDGTADAYEWEENGKGSCHKPKGCVFLLSSGKGVGDSYFADASADGSDAYIVTEDPLSGWDKGGGFERDLYVARVGGGLPEPPATPASCEGDACQPPPNSPGDTTPASASFTGRDDGVTKRNKHRRRKKKHSRKPGKNRHGLRISPAAAFTTGKGW